MKEYTATVKLNESELKDVVAGYFGIKKDDVFFTIVEGGNYDEGDYVNCEIHKKITVPENSEATLHYPPGVRSNKSESAYEHYCPNNITKNHGDYDDPGPYDKNLPCNKKKCDTNTRASCCGCPEYFEYMKKKGEKK